MFEILTLGGGILFAAIGVIFFYARSKWGCLHNYNDPSGGYQSCKKCNIHIKPDPIGCEHEFETDDVQKIGHVVKSGDPKVKDGWMTEYNVYSLRCSGCGEIRQKTVWLDKSVEIKITGKINDDQED
jgi:hypothetical protein